jgi:predicted metal-dependent phosphoesterase TrpH
MQDHFKQGTPSPKLDLHCHSTHSDGTFSPAQLVELATQLGLRAIALTDHDTVTGLPEFFAAAAPAALVRLGGVEISCMDAGRRLHILGLGVHADSQPLLDLLAQIREWRRERNRTMVGRLAGLGLPVPHGEMAQLAEETDVLGRPHLAALLVKAGICRDNRQAFARYLGRGKPGFVPRRVCSLDEAIQGIRGAGGVAVWAHPLTSGSLTVAKFGRLATEYASRGLDGLEAYYSEFSAHQTQVAERIAADAGLLLTGGSDFHGEHIPDIGLGTGYGALHVPEDILAPLLQRLEQRQAQAPTPTVARGA